MTAVRLLRFSNYLSGFVLGKDIDYSALQVVVRWINEALKTAPSGFESIVPQAEKLDSLIRLSSGWGFYDIWNAFLADATPSADGQPLEMLKKVCSFSGNAGEKILLGMHTEYYLTLSRSSKSSFPARRPLHPPSYLVPQRAQGSPGPRGEIPEGASHSIFTSISD